MNFIFYSSDPYSIIIVIITSFAPQYLFNELAEKKKEKKLIYLSTLLADLSEQGTP